MTSRYLAQIEKHLGVRLLNRTTWRLSLTEAGEDYYQRAAQVLGLVEEAEGGTVAAVYPSRQFLAPKVRSFVDFLVERFGGKPEWEAA